MTGILQCNGYAIGVLADSLIKKSSSSIYRKYIIDNKLVSDSFGDRFSQMTFIILLSDDINAGCADTTIAFVAS